MLAKPDAEVVYEDGVAVGVSSEGETAKAKLVCPQSCFTCHSTNAPIDIWGCAVTAVSPVQAGCHRI